MNTKSTRGRWFGRAVALLAPLLFLGVVSAGGASAHTASNGAYWTARMICDVGWHSALPDLVIKPRPGWSTQFVAYRMYMFDVRSGLGSTSAWATGQASSQQTVSIGGSGMVLSSGRSYRFWTQVMWWNGAAWTADTGWVENGYWTGQAGNLVHQTAVCYT